MANLLERVNASLKDALLASVELSGPDPEEFLTYVFAFLRQNTNFFKVTEAPNEPGLRRGEAERIVQTAFQRQWEIANPNLRDHKTQSTGRQVPAEKQPTSAVGDNVPPDKALPSPTVNAEVRPPTSCTWTQDFEGNISVRVGFGIRRNPQRRAVQVMLGKARELEVVVDNERVISGQLYDCVEHEHTWWWEDDMVLTVELSKLQAKGWPRLFQEDQETVHEKKQPHRVSLSELPEPQQADILHAMTIKNKEF